MELEFKIPMFSEIPHSSRGIPDLKAVIPEPTNKILPDFRLHKQKFPSFRDLNFFSLPDRY